MTSMATLQGLVGVLDRGAGVPMRGGLGCLDRSDAHFHVRQTWQFHSIRLASRMRCEVG